MVGGGGGGNRFQERRGSISTIAGDRDPAPMHLIHQVQPVSRKPAVLDFDEIWWEMVMEDAVCQIGEAEELVNRNVDGKVGGTGEEKPERPGSLAGIVYFQ